MFSRQLLQTLRQASRLARFVLAWFVLSIGVAVASPLVQPQAITLVCSAGGAMKILVTLDDGSAQDLGTASLDCPLCLSMGAPPPPFQRHTAAPVHPLSHALRPLAAAHIAERTAAPLPARGPPSFS